MALKLVLGSKKPSQKKRKERPYARISEGGPQTKPGREETLSRKVEYKLIWGTGRHPEAAAGEEFTRAKKSAGETTRNGCHRKEKKMQKLTKGPATGRQRGDLSHQEQREVRRAECNFRKNLRGVGQPKVGMVRRKGGGDREQ